MTKNQIIAALEERMVYYNNEVERWREIGENEPDRKEFIGSALNLCLGKALAYEEAWRLVKGE